MFNTSTISCFTGRSGSLCISIRMHWCLTSQHKLILRVVIGKTLWPGSQNGSISNYLLCAHHKALLCDWTIYTLLRSSVTHARICLPHARNHKRSIRRNVENGPASRIKMADCRVLVSMGRYSYLRNEAIIRKTPNLNTSEHYTETTSMSSLSLSCVSRKHTNTQNNSRNPRCACAPRVNYTILPVSSRNDIVTFSPRVTFTAVSFFLVEVGSNLMMLARSCRTGLCSSMGCYLYFLHGSISAQD